MGHLTGWLPGAGPQGEPAPGDTCAVVEVAWAGGSDEALKRISDYARSGINPLVVIDHLDMPEDLALAGGWYNRDTASGYARYAAGLAARIGNLAEVIVPLANPLARTVRDPGFEPEGGAIVALHHMLLAHAWARRADGGAHAWAAVADLWVSETEHEDSSRNLESIRRHDMSGNHVLLGPLLEGSYPQGVWRASQYGAIKAGDLAAIKYGCDLLGLNCEALVNITDGVAGQPCPAGGKQIYDLVTGVEQVFGCRATLLWGAPRVDEWVGNALEDCSSIRGVLWGSGG